MRAAAFSEVLVANLTFYEAFAASDAAAMDALWAESTPVTCTHPGWNTLHGRDAVMESWRAIFEHPGGTAVRCVAPVVLPVGRDGAVVVCREVVDDVPVAATNVFVREGGAWRLVTHHAGQIADQVALEDDLSEVVN